jgi:cyclopropane fatty-acyl-phospholipid synthase-like methyltransferase
LDVIPIDAKSVLDVGCGRGIIGALCRIYRNTSRIVGLDIYDPYLEFCRHMHFYDEVMKWDLRCTPLPFSDKEFDVTTAVEVVEHLTSEDALKLLEELERIAHTVVVSTPRTFFEQKTFDKNPFQRHISLLDQRVFRLRGYRVYGVGGMLFWGKNIKYVSSALASVTYMLPRLSSLLLCVKDQL